MNANLILYVQKDVNTKLIPEIDRKDYFQLKNPHSSRTQLFDFAIALGADRPTPLVNKADHTRGSYVVGSEFMYRSLLYNKEGEAHLKEEDVVCNIAEQYANTGFGVLEEYMQKYNDEALLKKLLVDMDKEFTNMEPEIREMLEME